MTEWLASRDQATTANPIMILMKTAEALAENATIDMSTLITIVATILRKISLQKLKLFYQVCKLL